MPPSVEFQGFENLEALITGQSESAVNEVLVMLRDNIVKEMPKKSGKLRESVEIIPAKNVNGVISGTVTFGKNLDYAWKVLVGSHEAERYHFAPKVMKFSDWDNGPDELRAPDGYFYFRRVRHNVPANNFLARALAKMNYRKVKRIFEERVRKAILKGR